MILQKKNRGHRTFKIVKSRKTYAMASCPIIVNVQFITQRARSLMSVYEFACAVRMRRNN